jgi:hypothetical protein
MSPFSQAGMVTRRPPWVRNASIATRAEKRHCWTSQQWHPAVSLLVVEKK